MRLISKPGSVAGSEEPGRLIKDGRFSIVCPIAHNGFSFSHVRGQEFESPHLHQLKRLRNQAFFVFLYPLHGAPFGVPTPICSPKRLRFRLFLPVATRTTDECNSSTS